MQYAHIYGAGAGANGMPMPVKQKDPPETDRFSWQDVQWFNRIRDDEFLTRPQLVEAVREQGAEIDEGTLVFWEKRGLLPRAIRRYRDGAPRALYPPRAVDVVIAIREMQQAGMTLDLIAPLMRKYALTNTAIRVSDPLRTSARFTALRLAISEERRLGLPEDTIRSVEFRFKGANGNLVGAPGEIDWSEEAAAILREDSSLVPFDRTQRHS